MSEPEELIAWGEAALWLGLARGLLDDARVIDNPSLMLEGCERIDRAARLLGYRLVPITTPQQEHDALLAARVAEDGPPPVTSAPGFDGRDSSIGMREQDIEGAAV